MKYLILVFLFVSNQIFSQNNNIIESGSGCGCEVILTAVPPVVDPGDPPVIGPDGTTIKEGNLSRFVYYMNGECIRTVEVKERYYDSGQIQYRVNNMVTDVNSLINQYGSFSTFCFDGYFIFDETIIIGGGRLLKLLDNSVFHYKGDPNNPAPAISFDGVEGGIEGGEIRTTQIMPDGLINITSDGSIRDNAISNTIKNTKLVNQHVSPPREGPPTAGTARANRGIVLSNSFETLSTQRDNGTNYFAHIIDVDISGFAVGLHMRGWSNAASIRNVRFKNISDYGIWISGCVDNSFSDISFDDCKQAYGFRFDNYIDDKLDNFGSNPNVRYPIDIEFELQELINSSSDQVTFNNHLDNLFDNNATRYFTIFESCENTILSTNPDDGEAFLNITETQMNGDVDLLKFGLKGYALDDDDIYTYKPDQENVRTVQNLRGSIDLEISLYKSSFNHPIEKDPNDITQPLLITLDDATCKSDLLYTNFYRAPAFNSISQVDIFKFDNGTFEKQVLSVVQIEGREDDGELCLDNLPTNDPNNPPADCDVCEYEFINKNGDLIRPNALGFDNSIYLCNTPTDFNPATEIVNTAECQEQSKLDLAISLLSY